MSRILESAKLSDLLLLLEKPELTREEREAIRKISLKLEAVIPAEGHITNIYGGDGIAEWQIIRRYAANRDMFFYNATSLELDNATNDATAGDVIILPTGTISGNHSFKAGVHYVGEARYACILSGQITLGVSTTLGNLSVVRTADSANELTCILGPASGVAYISNCHISSTQSGAGDAFGVSAQAGGSIETWMCYLYGESGSGSGYGVHQSSGSVINHGGRANGSTGPCSS